MHKFPEILITLSKVASRLRTEKFPIALILVAPGFFLKALISILLAYSFVNVSSKALASTPQLSMMALGLVVHAAQSVAVFGIMAAAWIHQAPNKNGHGQYANSHMTSK